LGFSAAGRPELVLSRTTGGPAAAAGVFTPNAFAAAPVKQSQANLAATSGDPRGRHGWAEVVISTSGSANAATGPAGDADQAEVGRIVGAATGVALERVLHLSTGIIGTRLPLDRVAAGVGATVALLATEDDGLAAAAEALRTTDSVSKVATTSVDLPAAGGGSVRVTVRASPRASG
jgi:glutamate N-acetyltransferase/amino-acid N-acetyltransferase